MKGEDKYHWGCVYVFQSDIRDYLIKIGMTMLDPAVRAKEIAKHKGFNGIGGYKDYAPYTVIRAVTVFNPKIVEMIIHHVCWQKDTRWMSGGSASELFRKPALEIFDQYTINTADYVKDIYIMFELTRLSCRYIKTRWSFEEILSGFGTDEKTVIELGRIGRSVYEYINPYDSNFQLDL